MDKNADLVCVSPFLGHLIRSGIRFESFCESGGSSVVLNTDTTMGDLGKELCGEEKQKTDNGQIACTYVELSTDGTVARDEHFYCSGSVPSDDHSHLSFDSIDKGIKLQKTTTVYSSTLPYGP
jgi:hypothetical protein